MRLSVIVGLNASECASHVPLSIGIALYPSAGNTVKRSCQPLVVCESGRFYCHINRRSSDIEVEVRWA